VNKQDVPLKRNSFFPVACEDSASDPSCGKGTDDDDGADDACFLRPKTGSGRIGGKVSAAEYKALASWARFRWSGVLQ
jgi:hypothetical protein